MNINKSCSTCEFNLEHICESHHSENGYRWNIDDVDKKRACWSISSHYSRELLNKLSKEERLEYEENPSLGIYDLVRKLETGNWK